jgi:hypothetical protein
MFETKPISFSSHIVVTKTYFKGANMYKIILAMSALFIMTAPSLAIDSTFVHSLRADNGDFEAPDASDTAAVHAIELGNNGNVGAVLTSKCKGVSPREYDPISPDCRN